MAWLELGAELDELGGNPGVRPGAQALTALEDPGHGTQERKANDLGQGLVGLVAVLAGELQHAARISATVIGGSSSQVKKSGGRSTGPAWW